MRADDGPRTPAMEADTMLEFILFIFAMTAIALLADPSFRRGDR